FIEFLVHTGLRISEARGLRWCDVDLGRRRIRVERRLYRGKVAPPKTTHGRRSVPLTVGMAQRLWEHRKSQVGSGDQGYVFAKRDGSAYGYRYLLRAVLKPAAEAAGLPWIGFHTLRHTCATMLFRRGFNAKQVQTWLGHSTPAFTLAR